MGSVYKAARSDAYNMSWNVGVEHTADKELEDNKTLKVLRQRSKQLVKDNYIVAGIQQNYINAVGAVNTVKVMSPNKIQQRQAQNVLDVFAKNSTIQDKSLCKVTEEIISSCFESGDILVSLPLDDKRKNVKTVVELIEAQRIRTPVELLKDSDVRHGVKYSSDGRILGYWVKNYDAVDSYSDSKNHYTFYPRIRRSKDGVARVVTQLFKAPLNSRPQMSRQYPIVTPILPLIKFLDDYLEAVIIGARVAACFAAFVVSGNPARAWNSFTTDSDGNVEDPQDSDDTPRRVHKLFPGMVHYLRHNEDIRFASPNRPNDNVDAFLLRIYKTIAMYLRIPYPILFLDLVDVNYSSWRGGANESKKMIQRWRKSLDEIVTWVMRTVLLEASINGLIRGDINKITVAMRWPVYGILDAEKEARANKIELENGTTSPQRICDEQGVVYEEVQQELLEDQLNAVDRRALELKRIKEKEKEYGIVFEEKTEIKQRQREKREGEGDVLDKEEKKKRRKDDGNW